MYRAKMEAAWWHTARLEASVINIVSKTKVTPKQLHPMYGR